MNTPSSKLHRSTPSRSARVSAAIAMIAGAAGAANAQLNIEAWRQGTEYRAMKLQRELSDTENKIQAARRFYNTNVRDLVTMLQSFPANVVAGMFPQFKAMEYFELSEADAAAKDPVKVKF